MIDANKAFNLLIKPHFEKIFSGSLLDIENEGKDLAKMFDQYAGVDYIHLVEQNNTKYMRGVAVRVQYRNAYNTFTIREKRLVNGQIGNETEFAKRSYAIFGGKGFWYPEITIQGYIDSKENPQKILSFSFVKTKDLYNFVHKNINNGKKVIRMRNSSYDTNEFLVVSFRDLYEDNCQIIIGVLNQNGGISLYEKNKDLFLLL